MPSPFPGMDPYLESPYIWPDLHHRFASDLSGWLNKRLPKPYYARLEMRPEVGVVEDEGGYVRRVIPDVAVVRHGRGEEGAIAVAEPEAISEYLEITVASEWIEHLFIEIRDPSKGHELVTVIEIASPANKSPGKDRDSYLKKQTEVLQSDANLIEIDLLRGGQRLFPAPELEAIAMNETKRVDYVVLVNRAWGKNGDRNRFQAFLVAVTEKLPCIPVPLRQGQLDIPLDLQQVFQISYDGGPYLHGAIDYSVSPVPPLPAELAVWAVQCLRNAGVIPASN